jgi:hypothetical protein
MEFFSHTYLPNLSTFKPIQSATKKFSNMLVLLTNSWLARYHRQGAVDLMGNPTNIFLGSQSES